MEESGSPFGGIERIIYTVNSPLALAALAILVVGTILYATRGGRSNPPLIYCGFGLAALFGVLAIAGFIYQNSMQQIDLVRGFVVDKRGIGVEGVLVDLFGIGRSENLAGRAATTREGNFVIPLEHADRRNEYKIEARKAGYERAVRENISGPRPEIGRIAISETTFSADNISIDGTIGLGMYLGVPEMRLDFYADNETDRNESVRAMSLTLNGPNNRKIALYPANYIDEAGRSILITQLSFAKLQKNSMRIIWNDVSQINNAMQRINQALTGYFMGSCTPGPIPEAVSNAFIQIFEDNFVWLSGDWKGRLTIRTENSSFLKSFSFNIEQTDLHAMTAMKSVYMQCNGISYGQHWLNQGSARSIVQLDAHSP